MMGRKTLSEIKAELGLLDGHANGKSPKTKPIVKEVDVELERTLAKKLDELEQEIEKGRKSKGSAKE